jgi:hypothetical protein
MPWGDEMLSVWPKRPAGQRTGPMNDDNSGIRAVQPAGQGQSSDQRYVAVLELYGLCGNPGKTQIQDGRNDDDTKGKHNGNADPSQSLQTSHHLPAIQFARQIVRRLVGPLRMQQDKDIVNRRPDEQPLWVVSRRLD